MDREAWSAAVHGVTVRHDWVTEQQLMLWYTWPCGLEVEPESCSSWRLMSPVAAAFEPFWFPFPQWGVYLLPRTAMLSDAARKQLLIDRPIPAESRHWQGKSSSRGVLWGAVVSWGVSTEWKKVHCTFEVERERAPWRSARNKIHRASKAQPLTPSIQGSRAPCYVGNSAGWELVRSSTLFPAAWWSLNHPSLSCPFSAHIPPWDVEGETLSASWETWIMILLLPTALWPWATF